MARRKVVTATGRRKPQVQLNQSLNTKSLTNTANYRASVPKRNVSQCNTTIPPALSNPNFGADMILAANDDVIQRESQKSSILKTHRHKFVMSKTPLHSEGYAL